MSSTIVVGVLGFGGSRCLEWRADHCGGGPSA